jgi:hypothetical protein
MCNYPLTTGCLIAGGCVATNAADPANSCRWCDPSMSTSSYVVHNAASCDDGSYGTRGYR